MHHQHANDAGERGDVGRGEKVRGRGEDPHASNILTRDVSS